MGAYLAYYDKKPNKKDKIHCPNGIFDISLMLDIEIVDKVRTPDQ